MRKLITMNTAKPPGASRPDTSVASPKSAVAATMLIDRFLKPPVAARRAEPATMPTEKAISTIAASVVVPPKWPSVIRGNRAAMGENTSENANPHHSSA